MNKDRIFDTEEIILLILAIVLIALVVINAIYINFINTVHHETTKCYDRHGNEIKELTCISCYSYDILGIKSTVKCKNDIPK